MAKFNKEKLARMFKEVGVTGSIKEGHDAITVFQTGMATLIEEKFEIGDEVMLSGFGRFYMFETAERIGRNPKDPGKEITIAPQEVVKFKMAPVLKEKRNEK